MDGFRQEVLNVVLAEALTRRGLRAEPEARMPNAAVDVLVAFRGLRLAIEGEVDDQPNCYERAWNKAMERVHKGLAYVGLAVVYPAALRTTPFARLVQALNESTLRFSFAAPPRRVEPEWYSGNPDFLRSALDQLFQSLLSEDEIRTAASALTEATNRLAHELLSYGVAVRRMAGPLGIVPESLSSQESRRQAYIARIGALVLANALMFQQELAKVDHRVTSLERCMAANSPHLAFLESWKHILDTINHHAVFDLAVRILSEIPADERLDGALRRCAARVQDVVRMQVALQHDLAGRLYHLLLGDVAKPLGTYYTSVSAANLLLRVALDPSRWEVQWGDWKSIANLRVADLACGTGTLLAAAVQALQDNFVRFAGPTANSVALSEQRKLLLQHLLEQGIRGIDVLPSAVHLTATTLALPVPEVMTRGVHLYAMDLGVVHGEARLGSIDLVSDRPAWAQVTMFPFAAGRQVTEEHTQQVKVDLPLCDLICMNPPFARTCGDNLLFGSLPPAERARLQDALRNLIDQRHLRASATVGLGSVFLAVADRYLKPGGRLAFVLPKALLSGVDWEPSRQLLKDDYLVEAIIVSHDPSRWNFSENTDLSEVLLVARKRATEHDAGRTLCVTLWQNPDIPLLAMDLAETLRTAEIPYLTQGALELWSPREKLGEAFLLNWSELKNLPHWLFPVAYAQRDLVLSLLRLHRDHLLSVAGRDFPIPLCPLSDLGTIGPDRRRLWATFRRTDSPPGYAAFWGHDANEVTTMVQRPNAYLAKHPAPRERQASDYPERLARQAGNVLLPERLWLHTQRLTALYSPHPVLSNVWWPFALKDNLGQDASKILTLWLNSTLGIFLLVGSRAETRGAWSDWKKPTLHALPVLDVRQLAPPVRSELVAAFDRLASEVLQPLPTLAEDPVRISIDQAVCKALGLPDIGALRRRLATEPIFSLQPLLQRISQSRS